MSSIVHVAVAVIKDCNGKILLSKRADDVHQGGLWEFPGGKVETDESIIDALSRELNEELGILTIRCQPLITIRHQYRDKTVLLDVWEVLEFEGVPRGNEGQPLSWVSLSALACRQSELTQFPLPEANYGIVKALRLPSTFAISDSFKDENDFVRKLDRCLTQGITLFQCRLPDLEPIISSKLLELAKKKCREYNARLFINRHYNKAKIECDGIHLTSAELMGYTRRDQIGFNSIGASCHNRQQLMHAELLDLDYVTLSPIKLTKSHLQVDPLGWEVFQELAQLIQIPVFALGGMNINDIVEAKKRGGQGIAAIREFWGY